jgi:DnaJ-class molecular chaperone
MAIYQINETEKHALLDLTTEQICALNDLLNGCSEKVLEPIRNATMHAVGFPVNKFKTEVKKRIRICKDCGGSQKQRVGNLRTLCYDIEPCNKCNGEGCYVKITSIRYETLSENHKIDFAR